MCLWPLSGPVLRDTARLSQRYPPIARYGVFGVSAWPIGCDTPSPFSQRFPLGEHAKWRCDTPPPQKGYLSDTGAIPYENKANGCDTPLCDTISKGYCAIWGGISHWAAKLGPQWSNFSGIPCMGLDPGWLAFLYLNEKHWISWNFGIALDRASEVPQPLFANPVTSLNKEVTGRFFLGDNSIWVFPLFLPLAITAFGVVLKAILYFLALRLIAFGAFEFIVPNLEVAKRTK